MKGNKDKTARGGGEGSYNKGIRFIQFSPKPPKSKAPGLRTNRKETKEIKRKMKANQEDATRGGGEGSFSFPPSFPFLSFPLLSPSSL